MSYHGNWQRRLAATSLLVALLLPLGGPANAIGPTPTVDRGLPTANLNTAAGADRSNVDWADPDRLFGDDFTVGSTGESWIIDSVRSWMDSGVVGDTAYRLGDTFSDITLFGGAAVAATGAFEAGTMPAQIATATFAPGEDVTSDPAITLAQTTYSDGNGYEASDGKSYQLWQVDFTGLDWAVDGGALQVFAVDGTVRPGIGDYWFSEASNAALSGSPQQGADDFYRQWARDGSFSVMLNALVAGEDNKPSDLNVQVFAHQVVAPTAVPTATATATATAAATATATPGATPGSAALDKLVVTDGGGVAIDADGFAPGSVVDINLHSTPVLLARVTADARGAIATTVTIPAGTSPGVHEVVASGTGSSGAAVSYSIAITVSVADLPETNVIGGGNRPGDGPPATGLVLLLIGVAVGVAFLIRPNRRNAVR